MMMFNMCGATSAPMRLWETHAMLMTPIDYWRAGVDLWFKTAEAQIETSFRVMAAMQGWDVALNSARGMRDDRVTLKAVATAPAKSARSGVARKKRTAPTVAKSAPAKPVSAVKPATKDAVETAPAAPVSQKKEPVTTQSPAQAAAPTAAPASAKPAQTAANEASKPANESAAPASRRRRAPSAPPPMPSAVREGGAE